MGAGDSTRTGGDRLQVINLLESFDFDRLEVRSEAEGPGEPNTQNPDRRTPRDLNTKHLGGRPRVATTSEIDG